MTKIVGSNFMTRKTLRDLVPIEMKEFASPAPLKGTEIKRFEKHNVLHSAELSMALGVNSAALYEKKKSPAVLQSSIAILLRIYAAFPNKVPRIAAPDAQKLMSKIVAIDPEFAQTVQSYSIGPLLGLEENSGYRFMREGLQDSAQTTKTLAWLIDLLLDEDPDNWWVIKNAVETEAAAKDIFPPSCIWKSGGWNKKSDSKVQDGSDRQSDEQQDQGGTVSATAFKPIRRRKSSTTTPE